MVSLLALLHRLLGMQACPGCVCVFQRNVVSAGAVGFCLVPEPQPPVRSPGFVVRSQPMMACVETVFQGKIVGLMVC